MVLKEIKRFAHTKTGSLKWRQWQNITNSCNYMKNQKLFNLKYLYEGPYTIRSLKRFVVCSL